MAPGQGDTGYGMMGTSMIHRYKKTAAESGFTIIEVVLVLAVAALIFLMVFNAFGMLQRGEHDSRRTKTLSQITLQIDNYSSSSRNMIPSMNKINTFVEKYLGGSGNVAGRDYTDPSTGEGYVFTATSSDPTELGEINYQTGVICTDDGGVTKSGAGRRNYALRTKLENQSSLLCVDNA